MYVCVFSSACHVPVELQGRSASHDPRLWLWRPVKASKMLPCYTHVPVCSIITHVVLELLHLRQDRFGRKAGRVGRRKKRTSSVVGEKHTASYLLTHLHIQHTLTIVWPSYYCSCADLRGESLYLHPQPHAAKCGQQQAPLYVATMLMIKVHNS